MALFCDFENVALGVRDAKYAEFDIQKVIERLLLKGNIVVKKPYCAGTAPRNSRRGSCTGGGREGRLKVSMA